MDVIHCVASFVEWFFLATSPVQTDKTLEYQEEYLQKFHKLKDVFADVSPSNLNFPKLHALVHVAESTRFFGTPDNADTETTEHQHRIEVKAPYKKTNKRDPLPQVVKFVERRTALEDKLDVLKTIQGDSSDNSRPSITSKYRRFSSPIPEGPLTIQQASKLFKLEKLELAIRTFFHDLKYPEGEGSRHRVSRKNLPKLQHPMVSVLCTRTRFNIKHGVSYHCR